MIDCPVGGGESGKGRMMARRGRIIASARRRIAMILTLRKPCALPLIVFILVQFDFDDATYIKI